MRNLKRALSLALASVMVLGLAVVGSNASYVDVTSKQNQEAIEVLQKVGIMVGDENGKFNPEAKVTRNEMAVIMANLMDYRVANYKGTSPFTDVPAWAEPYVAACYTNGIVSGYDAKTFGGNDSVATSQAALMLMKALGYFQYQSDFEDDWQLATVKQANKIDLFDDVDSNVKEAMTRNDVAQLVLNALKAGTVEANDDTIKVVTGGTTVEAGKVQYEYVSSTKSYATAIDDAWAVSSTSTSTSGSIVELGEKLYQGDLKLTGDTDAFGAPANRWTYKNAEIGTYAESPDYTFAGIVKSNAMYSAVSKNVANNYSWSVYTDGAAGDHTALQNAVKDNNKSDLAATVRGSNTYVYLNDEDETATVVVENIYIAEITKVKDGTVTLDTESGTKDFDIEGYKEGDMVLYTYADGDVQAILGKAELKEGTVETVRDQDRIVVDGTTYKYANKFNDSIDGGKLKNESVDQKVSFYLDGQGNIIAFEDASANNDYAFVYSIGESSSQYESGKHTYGAKLVLADGTVKSVIVDSDDTDAAIANESGASDLIKVQTRFAQKVVSYSVDDDGTYSLTVQKNNGTVASLVAYSAGHEDAVKNGSARVLTNGSDIYADKNTVFLINDKSDNDDDFSAYVGYKNVPSVDVTGGVSGSSLAYYSRDGVAKFVVITDGDVQGSASDVIFVVGNPNAKVYRTGSTQYYQFDAVVAGEVTTLKVKLGSTAATLANAISKDTIGVYFGLTKNSDGYVTKLDSTTSTDVKVNGAQNSTDTNNISYTEYTGVKRESNGGNVSFKYSAGEYTLSMAANDKAVIAYYDGDALSIATRLVTDKLDKATVVTDDGDIVAILVRDYDTDGQLAAK